MFNKNKRAQNRTNKKKQINQQESIETLAIDANKCFHIRWEYFKPNAAEQT